eukprot:6211881-Pleurochrysis_carterae.AAC.1
MSAEALPRPARRKAAESTWLGVACAASLERSSAACFWLCYDARRLGCSQQNARRRLVRLGIYQQYS